MKIVKTVIILHLALINLNHADATIKNDIIWEHFSNQSLLYTNLSKSNQAAEHSIFDQLLKNYVSESGKVNYKALKANPKTLNTYLGEIKRGLSENSTKNEKLAFWINAYNAFTLKMIIDNYPVKSIRSIHNGKPWDHEWIIIGNKTYSLNDIEHKIIRPQFKDPRIHFAVNCASISCPPLLNKAYTSANVDVLLEQVTAAFINSKSNKITNKSLILSPIFEWYRQDFGDVISFISKYSKIKPGKNAPITYYDYNWDLNETK